jgi:hypothetical protein
MGVSPLYNGGIWRGTDYLSSTLSNDVFQKSLGVDNMGLRSAGVNVADIFVGYKNKFLRDASTYRRGQYNE